MTRSKGFRDADRPRRSMRILHTADWHVGKTIRGRSRIIEHEAVLAEIADIARREGVDLVIVAGDIFDSAAPPAEAERVAYHALLSLSAVAPVLVLCGNHDNDKRLQALAPLLGLGHIVTRATFSPATEGGVVAGTTGGGEPWRVAVVPFLSQRWVVRAADLLTLDAGDHAGTYASRVARLVAAVTAGFEADAVNMVAAHLHVAGGRLGGGERLAHTIFDYAVSSAAFPATAHYVALGHLHRAQAIAGPCPIRYCGSPLQLDFGETADAKSVTIVDASPGVPAAWREVPLVSGRRLRVLRGSLTDLDQVSPDDDEAWLKIVVRESPRIGLADEMRERFPNAVDVVIDDPNARTVSARDLGPTSTASRTPHELFADYLKERGADDARLVSLFDRLLDEVSSAEAPV